ncbi:Fe(3+)-hydroxamate ABC transporter substrate-binding protein FhuD [Sodalis praecaptivus]|nr:Fe(3+)-hydroxamate ABC transporter substrate-binding protein FhuD [Sodalis praecaptivus]
MARRSSVIDANRRRVVTALLLMPWLPGASAQTDKPVKRIISLEWLPLELLFALGVTPLAAADTHDYRLWVREPALPVGVIDVGQRDAPNLEFIAELKPDLILYSQGYGPRADQFHDIAPAMEFNFTDERGHPLRTVRAGLLSLAERLDRAAAAREHLDFFDRQLADAKARLGSYRRQPLLVFSLIDDRHVFILGETSLFGDVMRQLAIDNAWQGENTFWGTAVVGIEYLAKLPPLRAICLDHGDEAARARVAATPIWKSLSFVRENTWRNVPAIWFFGATLSALRFCRMLEDLENQW